MNQHTGNQRTASQRSAAFRFLGSPALLALLVLLSACQPAERVEVQDTVTSEQAGAAPVNVRTVRARPEALSVQRSVTVTLEPRLRADVATAASGRVLSVLAREGDRLSKGQVVVQLDPDPARDALRDAELGLETARVQLAAAQRSQGGNLASLESAQRAAQQALSAAVASRQQAEALAGVGATSQLELTNLRSQEAQARSNLQQAQTALGSARRAPSEDLALLSLSVQQAQQRLQSAQRSLRDTEVRAPFEGVLIRRLVAEGEFMAAGSPAFTLADLSELEGRFSLPPAEAAALPRGLSVRYGGREYPARLESSAVLPSEGGLVQVTATVQGVASGEIPAGAGATLGYEVTLADGPLVPISALRREAGRTFVYTAEAGTATRHEVDIAAESGGVAAVRGLPSAPVIAPLPAALLSGDPVRDIAGGQP